MSGEGFTRLLDRPVAFSDVGDGTPIVLGHSFLCSRTMWAAQVPALAAQYRVVNVDYRGHGAAGPVVTPFSLWDLARDVLAVLDILGIRRAVWAGLSIGGMVALRAALLAPERVSALALFDSDAGRWPMRTRLEYALLGMTARAIGMRPLLPLVRKRMFGATTLHTQPDLVARHAEEWAALDVPSMLRVLTALNQREDLLPRLGAIAVPALVAVGAEDVALPPARSRRTAGALRHATFVEIPEAGHLSAVEQPGAVTDAMLAFLRMHA